MKTIKLAAAMCGLALVLAFGCESTEKTEEPASQAATQADVSPGALCDCGEVKGSDNCCNPDAEKCTCGKIKGSPGCCK